MSNASVAMASCQKLLQTNAFEGAVFYGSVLYFGNIRHRGGEGGHKGTLGKRFHAAFLAVCLIGNEQLCGTNFIVRSHFAALLDERQDRVTFLTVLLQFPLNQYNKSTVDLPEKNMI